MLLDFVPELLIVAVTACLPVRRLPLARDCLLKRHLAIAAMLLLGAQFLQEAGVLDEVGEIVRHGKEE
jgi:hypothetical protein